jgi:hypothetical protein
MSDLPLCQYLQVKGMDHQDLVECSRERRIALYGRVWKDQEARQCYKASIQQLHEQSTKGSLYMGESPHGDAASKQQMVMEYLHGNTVSE